MKNIHNISKIVAAHLQLCKAIQDERSLLDKKFREGIIGGNAHADGMAELDQRFYKSIRESEVNIHQERNTFVAELGRSTELDASMLHDDAKLLELDITLTGSQFTALVEKHKHNPLMTELLKTYQDKHEGLYADYVPSAAQKLEDMNNYASTAVSILRDPNSLRAAFFLDGKYNPVWAMEGTQNEA